MSNLEEIIKFHNKLYREGNPQISDEEYDLLIEKLKIKNPNSELLNIPIIEEVSGSRKVKLPIKMTSLNKEKRLSDVVKFFYGIGLKDSDTLIISPKYDGISFCFDSEIYITRGDGDYGQNITDHSLIANKINEKSDFIQIGECIISKKNWKEYFEGKINPSTGKVYSNPRNIVAGLLGSDSVKEEVKYIDFVPYGVIDKQNLLDKKHQLTRCKTPYIIFTFEEFKSLTESDLDKFYKDFSKDYNIDGIVIDIDSHIIRESKGFGTNGNPNYAIAYKPSRWSKTRNTFITGRSLNISKQGKLKGVINVSPVSIDGIEVKRATFYNAAFLIDFCLADNVPVSITRSGDVIPKITAVNGVQIPLKEDYDNDNLYKQDYQNAVNDLVSSLKNFQSLSEELVDEVTVCPFCDEPLVWDKTYTELVCTNKGCKGINISKILHFFTTLKFEEIGEQSIITLYEYGFDCVESLLTASRADLLKVNGFGVKTVDLLLSRMDELKNNIPFARLLHALDLFDGKMGEKLAQLAIDSLPNLANIDINKLNKINGFSDILSNGFIKAINDYSELDFNWNSYVSYVKSPKKTSEVLKNINVCFTGYRNPILENKIKNLGGSIASGVSSKATHLIVKDKMSNSTKTQKAKSLNIPIMSEDEFLSVFTVIF